MALETAHLHSHILETETSIATFEELIAMRVAPSVFARFHKGCGLVVETRENGRYR